MAGKLPRTASFEEEPTPSPEQALPEGTMEEAAPEVPSAELGEVIRRLPRTEAPEAGIEATAPGTTAEATAAPRAGRSFVECTIERSNGRHNHEMAKHRWMLHGEAANLMLTEGAEGEGELWGPTFSFEASRVGLSSLETAAETLTNYAKKMRKFYEDHPDEVPWKHQEAPSMRELGISREEPGWQNSDRNRHYYNKPRSFCEPEFRTLLIPVQNFTPKGPRPGIISISMQEHYDREVMTFDEQPERSRKNQRRGTWDTAAREAGGTTGATSSSGSGANPAEVVQGTAETVAEVSDELAETAVEGQV